MQEENKRETQQKWQNFFLTDQDEEMTQIIKSNEYQAQRKLYFPKF